MRNTTVYLAFEKVFATEPGERIDFLVSTFTGADAVYVMVATNFTVPDSREYYRRIGSNYAQAIQPSGVKRVVHLSSMGAHLDKGTILRLQREFGLCLGLKSV